MPRTGLTLVLLTSAGVSLALMQTLVTPGAAVLRARVRRVREAGFLLSTSVLTPILGRRGRRVCRRHAAARKG